MAIGIYAGPAKVYRAADTTPVGGISGTSLATAFQAEGENGAVDLNINEDTAEVASAMFGKQTEQTRDRIAELDFKPFDNWGSIPALYPPWIGVTTSGISGGAAGVIQVGGRPFGIGGNKVTTKVWTPDGRLYSLVRTAVIGHPSLHLGVGKALFGNAKIVGIGDETLSLNTSGFLFPGNALDFETGGADPGGQMTMADFVRGAWTGIWGTVAGFGGAAGSLAGVNSVQSEDEWTIESQVKYSPLKVQGRTYHYKLDSVAFMAKCQPYGPSQTDIIAAIGSHAQGQRLGSATTPASTAFDLTLSGPSAKTITLKNAEIKGAGFRFGGTTLGNKEIGFVSQMTFNAGAPGPLLVFSA